MKCIASNCKCNVVVIVATKWGNKEDMGFCDKHLPPWAKSKTIGLESPKVPMFDNKSFYQIKEVF